MIYSTDKSIYLRALEPEDLEFVFQIENDTSIWHISNTQTPYSKYLIKQYLENAHLDIYEAKQLRLVICNTIDQQTIGLIDLFDFDPKNQRAGIGILIHQPDFRNQQIGSKALKTLMDYAFDFLNLHQLYANIHTENMPSIKLFTNFGFQKIGVKKDWHFQNGKYSDEAIFQLINNTKKTSFEF